eukprot:855601-Prymnesium_polylepis.3
MPARPPAMGPRSRTMTGAAAPSPHSCGGVSEASKPQGHGPMLTKAAGTARMWRPAENPRHYASSSMPCPQGNRRILRLAVHRWLSRRAPQAVESCRAACPIVPLKPNALTPPVMGADSPPPTCCTSCIGNAHPNVAATVNKPRSPAVGSRWPVFALTPPTEADPWCGKADCCKARSSVASPRAVPEP